ncbi:phasin family protein [Maricaulis sp. D1M11]
MSDQNDQTETPKTETVKTAEAPAPAKKSSTRKPSAPGVKKPAVSKTAAAKASTAKTKSAQKATSSKRTTPAKAPAAKATVPANSETHTRSAMNETVETMTTASNQAVKEGFEKAMKALEDARSFNKETVDAVIESATVAGKGMEAVNASAIAYAKNSVNESVAATKAVSSAKSLQEVFEIQSDFVKASFEAYMAEMTKSSELIAGTFKDSVKPLNERLTATVEVAQSIR